MTTTQPGPAPSRSLPRGVVLAERCFAARHRLLSAVMLAQVPLLALLGAVRGNAGPAL